MSFLQLVINGFALGSAYALVALGFVLVVNAVNAVNFAQGDLVMAGGYAGVAIATYLPVPGAVMLPLMCWFNFRFFAAAVRRQAHLLEGPMQS